MFSDSQKGLFCVFFLSRLSIPTPGINQSSRGGLGEWSVGVGWENGPVCWFVSMACWGVIKCLDSH